MGVRKVDNPENKCWFLQGQISLAMTIRVHANLLSPGKKTPGGFNPPGISEIN